MVDVNGHWRNGRWVRPHTRRGGAAAGGGLIGVAVLAALIWGPGLSSTPPKAPKPRTVSVAKVLDGDTIRINGAAGEKDQKVRLLGIDTPERARDGKKAECGAAAARKALAKMIDSGTTITITTDPGIEDTDRYGRTLAYLDVDGDDAALALLNQGLGRLWTPEPGATYQRYDSYRDAAKAAEKANRGPCG